MDVIGKVLSVFSPAAALKREQNMMALKVLGRGYEAARRDRRTEGWNPVDDKWVNKLELEIIRKRSKDLYKNNPYAHRAHKSIANNTVGTGILPAIADEKLKKAWNEWADSIKADFDENLTFYGLQWLGMHTVSKQGECLVLRVRNNDKTRVPLEIKMLPPEYLDRTKDNDRTADGGWVINGIVYNAKGKKTGYYIYNQYPYDMKIDSTLWKKEDVAHLFEVEEPGQTSGAAFGTSSMMSLRDFDDYSDAQLMRQKIAACFAVFISGDAGSFTTGSTPGADDHLERVEPGIIEHLAPGKQVTFAAPPSVEDGGFTRNVLTGVASGFGVTYEAMTGDLSNVNFSSGRMGALESGRNNESWQWFIIIPKMCDVVWEWFVDAGVIAGMLPANTPKKVGWTAPRKQMIDPVKETAGLLAQVRAGFISWQEAVRSLGYTPEEILKEMTQAAADFDKAGLKPESDPRFDKPAAGEKEAAADAPEEKTPAQAAKGK